MTNISVKFIVFEILIMNRGINKVVKTKLNFSHKRKEERMLRKNV